MKDNATIPDKFIAPRRYPCSECHHGLCQFDDRGYINQYIKLGKTSKLSSHWTMSRNSSCWLTKTMRTPATASVDAWYA